MSVVVLVGVDCSNCSSRALEYAAERASVSGAKLVVAHVIEWSKFQFSTPQENEQRHLRREEEIARAKAEIIDPIIKNLSARGVEAEGVVRHGHPSETLVKLADELAVSSIVIGRRGVSGLKAQLFGSVPSSLVQIAGCPVTVVP